MKTSTLMGLVKYFHQLYMIFIVLILSFNVNIKGQHIQLGKHDSEQIVLFTVLFQDMLTVFYLTILTWSKFIMFMIIHYISCRVENYYLLYYI